MIRAKRIINPFGLNNILLFLVVLLLLSVDGSLQTSLIFNREQAWWTLFLFKIRGFSATDIIIFLLLVITGMRILCGMRIKYHLYLPICLLAFVYLFIGFIYNLGVYPLWKTFLYDVKVVLYLVVPYLFLQSINSRNHFLEAFTPVFIFSCLGLSSLIDFFIVGLHGHYERPAVLGLPPIQPLLPIVVCLVGIFFAHKIWQKIFFGGFYCWELISAINQIAGALLSSTITIVIFIVLFQRKLSQTKRLVVVFAVFMIIIAANLLLVYRVFSNPLSDLKGGGILTRRIQMENAIENYKHNIPGFIGKGLGSTWFEYFPIPKSDIYSVGVSVADTSAEAMKMPVKFIYNFGPASILHKWGILGSLLLVYSLTRYIHLLLNKIQKLKDAGYDQNKVRYLKAIAIITFLLMFDAYIYVGNLKISLVVSLMAFYAEKQIAVSRAHGEKGEI